jgi:hypothetical protein
MEWFIIFLVVVIIVTIVFFVYRYIRKGFDNLSNKEKNEIRKNVLHDLGSYFP